MSGQSIEISVIIPVYQASSFLTDAVDCAVRSAEVYENSAPGLGKKVQIVLVDDGSTDGSAEICDKLQSETILVRHTKNFGVSHARNIGMEMAEGKYITFLDADDKVTSEYLTDLYKAAAKAGAYISDMTDILPEKKLIFGKEYLEKAILFGDTHVWGKLFLKKTISDSGIRFREGLTIGEDMLFLMELALKYSSQGFACKAGPNGYIYTDNEQGAMKKSFTPSYLDQIRCWEMAEKCMKESGISFEQASYDRLSEIQIMSAMLVAGKIACRDTSSGSDDTALLNTALESCKASIKRAGKLGRGYKRLSAGYKLKVFLFDISSNLYLKLYGSWKR